ncbi:hypothetical protein J6590_023023 [Homalodisca vitripennis]|nr:hypothetical protein J6590_023023 [Homalodisca vitripennis]
MAEEASLGVAALSLFITVHISVTGPAQFRGEVLNVCQFNADVTLLSCYRKQTVVPVKE